jgi:peptidyl-prolyl cis-trans isomerase B (cyclophilin B)
MKVLTSICALSLALGFTMARAEDTKDAKKDAATPAPEAKEVAIMKTSLGEMVIEFWPDVAPKTVENFKTLARKGFYDGTAFHRIIKGFMIQGGDPNTKDPAKKDQYGQGGAEHTIKAEFNSRKHEMGVISMARSNNPDSASSQFFICDAPADNRGMQYLNGKYTAFGKLIKGEDVLEKIADTPVEVGSSGENSSPKSRIAIESVKIVAADSIK